MPDPLVTIAIPSYNHARWLPEAIESALGQTYANVEIVIVDDGSTDDSLAIARRYADAHPERVRVFTHPGQERRGIAATANRGVEEARGVYVSALSSDDVLLPDKLERQVELLEADPALVFVYGHTRAIDEDGAPLPSYGVLGEDISRDRRPLERLLQWNPVPGIASLVRRDALLRLLPDLQREELVYSDWHLWIALVARGRVGFVERVVALSRIHRANTSVGIPIAVDREHSLAVLDLVAAEADEIGGALAEPQTRALLQLELALRRHERGDLAIAAGHLEHAVAADPALGDDPRRLSAWLQRRTAPHDPTCPADVHLTAARWLARGASGEPPPETAPAYNFGVWVSARWPDATRQQLARKLAELQLIQAAFAAERAGERAQGGILALRTVLSSPSQLRESAFLRLLARLAAGPRLTALVRRLRGR